VNGRGPKGIYLNMTRRDATGTDAPRVWIGTSGWHYKHWVGAFYPPKTPAAGMLDYYIQFFDTVEINNSFYRLPPESALADWRNSTPPGFLFAMKGSRFLTHMKKLKDAEQGLERFLQRAEILRGKLGPILFQLPPQWEINRQRLEDFLRILPTHHRYAFEFRNASWNTPSIYDLLSTYHAGYCIFHLAGAQSPIEITAPFAYLRLHGPGEKYQGSYSNADLHNWVRRISRWTSAGLDVYVYFDNDDSGYAAQNALSLKRMVLA
jgi:uncharacterized protein YecE (DUF72 family)